MVFPLTIWFPLDGFQEPVKIKLSWMVTALGPRVKSALIATPMYIIIDQ